MMKQKIITTLLSLLMLCSFAVVHVDAQEAEKTTPPALAAGFSYSAAELGYGGGDIVSVNGETCSTAVADGTSMEVGIRLQDGSVKTVSYPVVDCTARSALFYSRDRSVKTVETEEGMILSATKDGSATFLRPLSAAALVMNLEFQNAEKLGALTLTLTDAANSEVSLTLKLNPEDRSATFGSQRTEGVVSDSMVLLKYNNYSRRFQDTSTDSTLFTCESDDLGNAFDGFSGGVYLTVGFENTKGNGAVCFKRLMNQPLGTRDGEAKDQTEPVISLTSQLVTSQRVGDTFILPSYAVYDVFSEIAESSVSVQSPSGKTLYQGDGEGFQPFAIDEYGKYKITIRASDTAANSTEFTRTVNVGDDVAPELTVSPLVKTEYKPGAEISIPSYTVTDNQNFANVDVILLLPNSERAFLLHDDNGNVTSYICNRDVYPASFGVSDNSFHAEQMGNYILRFIAYDDMYNRTVVELPFTVR